MDYIKELHVSRLSEVRYEINLRLMSGKKETVITKEVHLDHTLGVPHVLKTLGNYLDFMASALKKRGKK